MGERGMEEVPNPSQAFLAERLTGVAGSSVVVTMEGTRPFLAEIQALTSSSSLAQPRRTANGMDYNRLLLLVAVLSKGIGLELGTQDVFVNVVGGMRIEEPAADLAVALAIASSFYERPVDADMAIFGEIGLLGELRAVRQAEQRMREAARLGFRRCVIPRTSSVPREDLGELEVVRVSTLREALKAALQG
jgi:DNA repair protein RadA/Sms